MRVLVTGGCGFVGAHTIRALLARGHDVVAYDPVVGGNSLDVVLSEDERAGVTLVAGDVSDLPLLLRACQTHGVEAIIHLAFVMGIVNENPSRAITVNCQGGANVFETAALLGMRKVVWAGSNAVFGPPERYTTLPLADDAPHYPDTIYGASKSFVERLAAHYRRDRGVTANGVRLVIMYGPGRQRGGAMHVVDAFQAALDARPYAVPFPEELQSFLYVADAGDCLAMLIDAGETPTPVYNLAGESSTVWDYAAKCVEVVGPAKLERGDGAFASRMTWHLSNAGLESDIGFRPRRNLEAGLSEWRDFETA